MKIAHLAGFCTICKVKQTKKMPLEMYEQKDRPSIKCPKCKLPISMKIEKMSEE